MRKNTLIIFYLIFIINISYAESLIKLSDDSGNPVEYAYVRIVELNKVYISNESGIVRIKPDTVINDFTLDIRALRIRDTLISINLINQKQINIILKEDNIVLPEFEISYSAKSKVRKKGFTNKFLTGALVFKPSDTTVWFATHIDNDRNIELNKVFIHVRYLRSDTFYLGFNILLPDTLGMPDEHILSTDIITPVADNGWVSVDLSNHRIFLDKDFFIKVAFYSELERISDKKDRIGFSNIEFSAKFPIIPSKTLFKLTKDSDWEELFLNPVVYVNYVELLD